MDNFDLKDVRSKLVAKDNRLIQKSQMSLGLVETKALSYMISKISPDDESGKPYVFNCKEFQALIKWNKDASYKQIKDMLDKLGDASWWIRVEINGREKLSKVRWLTISRIDTGNGNVEIGFHPDMLPYLLDLKKHLAEENSYYTAYKLQNITLMKHRYSPRIYELLKSYQFNNKKWTFENGTGSIYDLQILIAETKKDSKTREPVCAIPAGWSNWYTFRRDVLDPAVKEINKYTDIRVTYEGKKEDIYHHKTRGIRTIVFYMVGKTEPEQRETNRIIDAEYDMVGDDQKYHQTSIEELFFKDHEKRLQEEKIEKDSLIETEKAERIEKAKNPILFAELNGSRRADLDEKKVNQLYSTAIRGRVAGEVKRDMWEMFATDLITYYYDKIMSAPEETKTTVYKRLLDCVLKDYDGMVAGFQDKYRK